ncbi:kinetochore component CENP-S-domain-containing protein [Gongronella butleri]|nr:kinetochore component CENP-S-domain-containing protein [Gongronella butleri]
MPDRRSELQAAVMAMVNDIVKETTSELAISSTPAFVAALSDVVYQQMVTLGMDAEAFAKHARRSTINMEDILLCARRNDDLLQKLSEFADDIRGEPSAKKKRA